MVRKLNLANVLMIGLLTASVSFASAIKCVPVEVKAEGKEIILPGPDQPRTAKVYFFKNLTKQSVWIDHPVTHASSTSAGWSSYLRADNSSAMLVNRKNFSISCALIKPGKVEMLNCAKTISVCMPSEVVMTSSRKGTYWLAEDKPWDDLLKALNKRGVQIK